MEEKKEMGMDESLIQEILTNLVKQEVSKAMETKTQKETTSLKKQEESEKQRLSKITAELLELRAGGSHIPQSYESYKDSYFKQVGQVKNYK